MTRESRARALLYALFTLSGFAGLIYESIWSHYLKLFLGHAAYAQTLVLVIFMGGMAIGSWIAGQWTPRLHNPLRTYAWVEGALGLGALAFDPLFRGMQSWMFDTVMPSLGSPLAIDLCKWSASGLIVLPQSILLGATFPLISAGVIRLSPATHGRSLGWLYFTNSLGASVGVLVSGFVLIGAIGLPGTIASAGAINFALAAAVLLLSRNLDEALGAPQSPPAGKTGSAGRMTGLMLYVAFFTGMASFFYEIGWLRMLSLVLGSATHAFELMLSAFILGIAVGSFFIRTHIDDSRRPLRLLAWIQVAMATAAFLTIPVYNQSFGWMAFILQSLRATEPGYVLFNLLSHGICVAIMLPVTIFAGMTLPLITAVMLRQQAGESSIGRIYAANTFGSIVGVLVAVHLVMPLLGLRQVVVTGAIIDMGVGLWLFRAAEPSTSRRIEAGGLLATLAVAAYVAVCVHFNPSSLASGVYRYGNERRDDATIRFHRDGKAASVDVFETTDGFLAIATNGKIDAGMNLKGIDTGDDYTMVLTGAISSLQSPEARQAAVIGVGSGRTSHVMLANPRIESLDTVEIEPAMVEGARQFKDYSHSTFDDPRSHVRIEDAKTYFARNHQNYDVIVAEPSNPWVSGVSSLFSGEFYGQIKRRLKPDGYFVQWLQIYEINEKLVGSVLKAIDANFSDYAIYATCDADLLIIARPQGELAPLSTWGLEQPSIARYLDGIDLHSIDDLNDRRVATRKTLAPFIRNQPWGANSDYRPILDERAVKYRFLHADAESLLTIRRASARLENGNVGTARLSRKHGGYHEGIFAQQAQRLADAMAGRIPPETIASELDDDTLSTVAALHTIDQPCDARTLDIAWLPRFLDFGQRFLPYMSKSDVQELMGRIRTSRCFPQASDNVRRWVALLEASGSEDWGGAQRAGAVLMDANLHDVSTLQLLAREMLLADIKLGDYKAAAAHASRFAPGVFDAPPVEYLRAYAAAQ